MFLDLNPLVSSHPQLASKCTMTLHRVRKRKEKRGGQDRREKPGGGVGEEVGRRKVGGGQVIAGWGSIYKGKKSAGWWAGKIGVGLHRSPEAPGTPWALVSVVSPAQPPPR